MLNSRGSIRLIDFAARHILREANGVHSSSTGHMFSPRPQWKESRWGGYKQVQVSLISGSLIAVCVRVGGGRGQAPVLLIARVQRALL
jgi:hypothetical protein